MSDNAVKIIFTFLPIVFEPRSQLGRAVVASRYGCNYGHVDSVDYRPVAKWVTTSRRCCLYRYDNQVTLRELKNLT